jgi:hypothetical protein
MIIEFQPAIVGDLPQIGRVVVDAWRSTFAGLLPVISSIICPAPIKRSVIADLSLV